MNDTDQQRVADAREKRRRKLTRYTDTPAARARRAEMEREFQNGTPVAMPIVWTVEPDPEGKP